ncbi:sulfate/molybdate ABC transporter ATP-binding protein [Cellulomonas edaphi]|uniref:ATP-binding cassette domain-containing protein n=1 Tax=Cellulomonas edaphi TaxID=3053468 RepID=A0ABT7S875_9CELL|nr:ATP-binding cassette domain-containing protein [Cellulomons edaphi]MDM7831822.1 ATP-binding cassette domain-containing protein [Cellulomons edaphi]
MSLHARVVVRRTGFVLDAQVEARPGRIVAVVGPNGAGKSTLLAAVAGLVVPDEARIDIGDRTLTDTARGVHVPPERRDVGLLGQDPLVFPHLVARENVAFGPRSRGAGARESRAVADRWLADVGLAGLGDRRPDALSGGQRQRVALARALAPEPAVLLLDEPFAQLDVRTAAELRDLVRAQVRRTGTAAVLVTHDVLDALTLADHVVVLHEGRVVEQGDALAVLTDPVHPFTAALAGVNLVVGTMRDGAVRTTDGVVLPCGDPAPASGARAQATFPPSSVRFVPPQEAGWDAHVVDTEPGATGIRVRTTGDVLVDVLPAVAAGLSLQVGAPVRLAVDPSSVRVRAVPTSGPVAT